MPDGHKVLVEEPRAWAEAIAAIVSGRAQRVMVIGGTDAGKSSFARAALATWMRAGDAPLLLDTDPGQKMVGPPGTVTLGDVDPAGQLVLQALSFVGTTSAAAISEIMSAATALARRVAGRPLIINTSGLVRGPGVPLLLGLIERLSVDQLVVIGSPSELQPILLKARLPTVLLDSAPAARRKGRGERASSRRDAFKEHLAPASRLVLPRSETHLLMSPTVCLALPTARSVCVLSDSDRCDLSLGVLETYDHEALVIAAPSPMLPVQSVRLGSMWAQQSFAGWQLLDELLPAFAGTRDALVLSYALARDKGGPSVAS